MKQASKENPFTLKPYKEIAEEIWGEQEDKDVARHYTARCRDGMQVLFNKGHIRYLSDGSSTKVVMPIPKQDEPPKDKNTPTQATNDEWNVSHHLPPLKINEANAPQSEELPSLSAIMAQPIEVSSVSRPPHFVSQSITPSVGELLTANGLYNPKKRVAISKGSSKRIKISKLVDSGVEPQTGLPTLPVSGISAEDSKPWVFYQLPPPLPYTQPNPQRTPQLLVPRSSQNRALHTRM